MPQSLTIDGSSASTGSVKRQRSADGRELNTSNTDGIQKWPGKGQPLVSHRVPPYLDKSKNEIAAAFQDLEWKQRFRLFHAMENPHDSPFRVDRSEIVIKRNRYGNVQPWDQSRVKLKVPFEGSDYINASPVVLKFRDWTILGSSTDDNNDTRSSEARYIATQGPKDGQSAHFWHMVFQETTGDQGVVVMLTQCFEGNKDKCAQYFPSDLSNPTFVLARDESTKTSNKEDTMRGDTVSLKSHTSDISTGSEVRILELTVSGVTKTIHHFLYTGWPDFGRPEAEDRIALVALTRETRSVAKNSPRIVHCSAGVGRTGTFIALDYLVHEIEEGRLSANDTHLGLGGSSDIQHASSATAADADAADYGTWGRSGPPTVLTPTTEEFGGEEKERDYSGDLIYTTVNSLREQRMMMVMNELQYAFLYEVVREVFWEKYQQRPAGAVVKGAEDDLDMPPGKVPKVVEDEAGSGSEAETEIMGKQTPPLPQNEKGKEVDPYAQVAPEQIRQGLDREP